MRRSALALSIVIGTVGSVQQAVATPPSRPHFPPPVTHVMTPQPFIKANVVATFPYSGFRFNSGNYGFNFNNYSGFGSNRTWTPQQERRAERIFEAQLNQAYLRANNPFYPYNYGYGTGYGCGYTPFGSGYGPNPYSNMYGNPYLANGYGIYPYAMPYGSPVGYGMNYGNYGTPSVYGNVGGGYGGGGNGGGGNGDVGGGNRAAPDGVRVANFGANPGAGGVKATQPSPLTLFGIPTENGDIQWPLGLRVMPPNKKELLDKTETLLKFAASQAVDGKVTPAIARQAIRSVGELHQWLNDRRSDLPEGTYRDAERFLLSVERALNTMTS